MTADLTPDSWSTSQLVEFLAVLSEQSDEAGALRAALERVLEALDAEVGVLFNEHGPVTVLGLCPDDPHIAELISGAQAATGPVQVAGLGDCRTAMVALDPGDDGLHLLVARVGPEDFVPEEMLLL